MAILLAAMPYSCAGADKLLRPSLESFLKRTGYEPIPLQRVERNRLVARAELNQEFNLVLTCDAKVNDRPTRLAVDTGAYWSCLDRTQISRLGLKPRETRYRIVGVGKIGSHWLDVTKLKSLQLGDLLLTDLEFGVADMRNWGIGENGQKSFDVQGVLGTEQLTLNEALIDCCRLKLWLRPLEPTR